MLCALRHTVVATTLAAALGAASGAAPPPSDMPAASPETTSEPASAADRLLLARHDAIAAARQVQERELALAAIRHDRDLLASDAEAGRRGLAESRTEQEALLATALHRARAATARDGADDRPLLERLRAEALLREADLGLRAQLRALTGEIARLDALRQRIAAKQAEEETARQALMTERERLATAMARRDALLRELAPGPGIEAALRIADIEREAKKFSELIRRAEAAFEKSGKQRDRGRTGGSRTAPVAETADPTRPATLRSLSLESGIDESEPTQSRERKQPPEPDRPPPQPLLVPPAVGTIAPAGGAAGAPDAANEAMRLQTAPGAVIVAPFDGRVIYSGPFRDFERALIIRHDRRYYSVLAGLGRIDATPGDWVLAGEPVGAMPDPPPSRSDAETREADTGGSNRVLYYELRRDGRPVDPQPWLARVEDRHDGRNGSGR
jgi:septal ring factor EnvC (AmiA/AmiB activator)